MHSFTLASLLILPSAVLPPARQNHIALEDATRAIFSVHPELAGASVDLPTAIPTREAAPDLQAGPIEYWAGAANHTAHVRLHCESETICRPFYATLHLPSDAQTTAQPKPAEPALHSGTRASMLIDSGRIHLRIPVTCLGGGAPGALIRVAGPKNARFYQVTVIDNNTVRGTL